MQKIQKYLPLVLLFSVPTLYGVSEIKVQERVDHAWKEREHIQQETAETNEQVRLVKNRVSELQQEIHHAQDELSQAEKALYTRETIDPHLQSETFVDKVEEAALATKDMVVDAATGTKDMIATAASIVVNTVKALPDAAMSLAASTATKTKTVVQEARAKHAETKVESALETQKNAEKELDDLHTKRELLQIELAKIEEQKRVAHTSLVQAQEVARARNTVN